MNDPDDKIVADTQWDGKNPLDEVTLQPNWENNKQVKQISGDLLSNIADMKEEIAAVSKSVSRLEKDFETKIKYDQSKERTIDTLHRELQDYRDDLNFKILRPLVMDLINLYDDRSKVVANHSSKLHPLPSDIHNFMQDIEDLLARHGFEIYQTESEIFDRALQKPRKTIATDNKELDRHIVERLRKGLRYGERILRPEIVTVYRYKEK